MDTKKKLEFYGGNFWTVDFYDLAGCGNVGRSTAS